MDMERPRTSCWSLKLTTRGSKNRLKLWYRSRSQNNCTQPHVRRESPAAITKEMSVFENFVVSIFSLIDALQLVYHTPMPDIAGLDLKSPCCTNPAVQLTPGLEGYRLEHSKTDVAEPMVVPDAPLILNRTESKI